MLGGFEFETFLKFWELSVPRGGLNVVRFWVRESSLRLSGFELKISRILGALGSAEVV